MRKLGYSVSALFAVIAAGFALAACGGGSDSSTGDTAIPKEALGNAATTIGECSADPKSGGTLVYSRRAQAQDLNPLVASGGNGDIFVINQIFDQLVTSNPDGGFELSPAIAESWDISDDGKTYTFHIREGIKFSNGQPVTAEDVKFSLDRFADPKLNLILAVAAVGYEKSVVVDPQTVRVELSEPVAAFLYNISIYPASIVPKDLVLEQGDAFWDNPVGTGPFMVKKFTRGSSLTFAKNPNYWEEGKPYLDSVKFNFAEEDNSRMLDLKSGKAQMVDGVPYSQIPSVLDDDQLQLQVVEVPQFLGLWLNHERPQLADEKVRQAMQYALNRDEIDTAIYRGVGSTPNSVLPRLKFDAPAGEVEPYPYDVEQAKSAIGQSKYPDGFDITLKYPAGFEDYKQLGLYLQQAWEQIGINVKLLELDQAAVGDAFYAGDYDMTFPYAQFTSDVTVPDEYANLLNDPDSGTDGFFSWWHDEPIWEKVKQFTTTIDEETRAEQWPVIQQEMLDTSPVINVLNLPFVNAHREGVCGSKVDALGSDQLQDTWLTSAE